MTKEQKVLITGCARSGTSLILYLMRYFDNTLIVEEETNPFNDLSAFETPGKRLVIKCPQGQQMDDEERALGDFSRYGEIKTLQDVIDHGFKIILIIRDSRDVLVSKHYLSEYYWTTAPRWLHSTNHVLKMQETKNPNILFLYFEDFVEKPDVNLNKISEFLGCGYSQNYKEFYKDIDQDLDIAKAMNKPRPITTDNIGNWCKPEHHKRMCYLARHYGKQLSKQLINLGYEKDDDWLQQFQ